MRVAPASKFVSVCCTVQLMAQNLRGELSLDFTGTNPSLRHSRFIKAVAESLRIRGEEVSYPNGSILHHRHRDDFFFLFD